MISRRVGHVRTYEEFLEYVSSREGRFEYVDGYVLDMGTPSNEHQELSLLLAIALHSHLRGSGCKVRQACPLWTNDRERSPDILVTCDSEDLALGNRLNRRPKLIIEILSPNIGDDLELKLDEYEGIPSVEEYVVIDSTKRAVRRWYRNASGKFEFDPYYISGSVFFASVGFNLDIDALYREVGIP
jgi:Uma2 family endonuclease